MGMVGIEPTWSIDRQILSLLRLPVPPQSRTTPPRFELGKRDPKSPVIPFHHGVTSHARASLRALRFLLPNLRLRLNFRCGVFLLIFNLLYSTLMCT